MKKYALLRYCLVFLAIVLPYFSAATINGPERVLAERVPDMEEYLPVIVFSQISPDMKKETIKAQTVIARSNIQRWLGEGKNLAEILRENGSTEEVWRYFFAEKRQIYEQAAKETDGQVLTYEGKVRLTPWHKRSAGKTRSGEEAFHDEAYTYLKSADSSEDKKSPDHKKIVEIPEGQLSGELLLLCSDGLTNAVPREDIEQLLGKGSFYDLPDRLVDTADENGGPDNITALLLGVEPLEVRHG